MILIPSRTVGGYLRLSTQFNYTLKGICSRSVSKWTPLEQTFHVKPSFKFSLEKKGLFGIPELREPSGFYLLQNYAENEVESFVEEALSSNRSRKMVQIFDDMSDSLCKVADMCDFLRCSHPEAEYVQASTTACFSMGSLVEKLNVNRELYDALQTALESGDKDMMDDLDARVGNLFLFDFQQSGIHLPKKERDEFVSLHGVVQSQSSFFLRETNTPVCINRTELPQEISSFFPSGNSVTISSAYLDHPNEMVRMVAYRLFYNPISQQGERLKRLLEARDQIAKLTGFSCYAERAARGSLAGSQGAVQDFLETLACKLRPLVDEDISRLKKVKKDLGGTTEPIWPWDVHYYSSADVQQRFGVDTAAVASCLPLGSVMQGLSHLFESLYAVQLEPRAVADGEAWHPLVHKIAVVHETEGELGCIYCDLYDRPGKTVQNCHFTVRGGRLLPDGTYQQPVVVLSMSLTPPPLMRSAPTLLSPSMAENLFHEMGHAMHSMLGRTRYQHITGTRCATDFAEVPSTLMEYFMWNEQVLKKISSHHSTRKPLDDEVIGKLVRSRRCYSATELLQHVIYALTDQALHTEPTSTQPSELYAHYQHKYSPVPVVPGIAWEQRFGHLVAYGAKYYSYLISRAVASLVWQCGFQHNPYNREMGEKWRREVLEQGGGKHPIDLIEGFTGQRPTTSDLADALVNDIEKSYNNIS